MTSAPPSTLQEMVLGLDHESRGMTFGGAENLPVTFAELAVRAREVAGGFLGAGAKPGERVILVLPDEREFVEAFLGAVVAGLVPVPLFPPFMLAQLDSYLSHTERIVGQCESKLIVTIPEIAQVLDGAMTERRCISMAELQLDQDVALPRVKPDDMAFIQYTSGSTSDPKGVVNTHRCLLDNVADFADHMRLDPERDWGVTWLPLYHDMGLIGGVMLPALRQGSVWFMPPLQFARHPTSWFDLIHEVRATTTFAPNFGYGLVTRRATDEQLEGWDLSCLRIAGCAAEPIRPDVLRAFERRFAPAGFSEKALLPCYGLAEATLGVTLSEIDAPWGTHRLDAERLRTDGVVGEPEDGEVLEVVSCGRPLPSYRVRIVDEAGRPVGENREGEIEIQTPCLTSGYYRDPDATAEAIRDGWLATGDLGFQRDGELYVTGRSKDVLIVNGRNVHPQDVEWCAAEVDGVRPGNVVACPQPTEEGEEVLIVLEASVQDGHEEVRRRVAAYVRSQCRVPVAAVVVLEKGTLPKTTSGKLRRRATREAYERGDLAVAMPAA